jgi:hypothetical protein
LSVELSGDSVLQRPEEVRGPWKVAGNSLANRDLIHRYRKEFPRLVGECDWEGRFIKREHNSPMPLIPGKSLERLML